MCKEEGQIKIGNKFRKKSFYIFIRWRWGMIVEGGVSEHYFIFQSLFKKIFLYLMNRIILRKFYVNWSFFLFFIEVRNGVWIPHSYVGELFPKYLGKPQKSYFLNDSAI